MARNFFITGGAGFIGSNYVDRLVGRGEVVTVYDNMSRLGAARNIEWLRKKHGEQAFRLIVGEIRDASSLAESLGEAEVAVHLASQVAVTTSVANPLEDFEINALGTLNLLEAARLSRKPPIILYASTNKVYGGMEDIPLVETETRYRYADLPHGIPETQPLDFHSPYGCSKGCGDQYVHDYSRIYGLPTVVFRQSCIYGPRQFGVEDQGWLAWFAIAQTLGRPITIYGDGKQVRDVLYVTDLLDAFDAALARIEHTAGEIYNLGGGPDRSISVWKEFGPLLERLFETEIPVKRGEWRPGDQRIYVSDIRKAREDLGWEPKVGVEEGVTHLVEWVKDNRELF